MINKGIGSNVSKGETTGPMDFDDEGEKSPIQSNDGKKCQRTINVVDVSNGFDVLSAGSAR